MGKNGNAKEARLMKTSFKVNFLVDITAKFAKIIIMHNVRVIKIINVKKSGTGLSLLVQDGCNRAKVNIRIAFSNNKCKIMLIIPLSC